MSKLEWRIIKANTKYVVSSEGHVRNTKTGRILKATKKGNGYYALNLGRDCRDQYVHRLVAIAFVGDIPTKKEVNHIDGNKENNFRRNLEIISSGGNSKHAYHKGLRKWGGAGRETTLMTPKRFLRVLAMKRDGKTPTQIHKAMPELSRVTISDILNKKTWIDMWKKFGGMR